MFSFCVAGAKYMITNSTFFRWVSCRMNTRTDGPGAACLVKLCCSVELVFAFLLQVFLLFPLINGVGPFGRVSPLISSGFLVRAEC